MVNSAILELVWRRVQSKTARASAALFVVLNAVGALRCFVAVPRSWEALVFPTPIGVVLVLFAGFYWAAWVAPKTYGAT